MLNKADHNSLSDLALDYLKTTDHLKFTCILHVKSYDLSKFGTQAYLTSNRISHMLLCFVCIAIYMYLVPYYIYSYHMTLPLWVI